MTEDIKKRWVEYVTSMVLLSEYVENEQYVERVKSAFIAKGVSPEQAYEIFTSELILPNIDQFEDALFEKHLAVVVNETVDGLVKDMIKEKENA